MVVIFARQVRPRLAAIDPAHWLTVAATGWLGLVVLAPVAPAWLATFVYLVGAQVCHQLPERSFHLGGAQLAVCARCAGIYAGAAATFLALGVVRRQRALCSWLDRSVAARTVLGLGVLPTAATLVLEYSGWWMPSNLVRAGTGVVLGAAAALVAGRAATVHYEQWRQRRLA